MKNSESQNVVKKESAKLDPENWVSNYRTLLFALARRKTSSDTIAEDLVQETFLGGIKAQERFRGDCSERSFLVSILRKKIADHYRRAHTRLSTVASEFEGDVIDEGGDSWMDRHALARDVQPQDVVDRAEFMEDLEDAINHLPESMRTAYRMREIQNRSTDEIIRTLSISKNNLWVLIHRAKAALRDELSSWNPTGPVPSI